jgi:hypothetical protein
VREFDDLEVWLPVPGFAGRYEVSNQGRVRSLDAYVPAGPGGTGRRLVKGRILKPGKMNKYGHCSVVLTKEGGSRCVHELVLLTFDGPRPDGCEARHLDLDGSNNKLTNLLWGTKQENSKDVTRAGARMFTYEEADALREKVKDAYACGSNMNQVAVKEGLNPGHLWLICNHRYYIR